MPTPKPKNGQKVENRIPPEYQMPQEQQMVPQNGSMSRPSRERGVPAAFAEGFGAGDVVRVAGGFAEVFRDVNEGFLSREVPELAKDIDTHFEFSYYRRVYG